MSTGKSFSYLIWAQSLAAERTHSGTWLDDVAAEFFAGVEGEVVVHAAEDARRRGTRGGSRRVRADPRYEDLARRAGIPK
jgi:hypothetical protein